MTPMLSFDDLIAKINLLLFHNVGKFSTFYLFLMIFFLFSMKSKDIFLYNLNEIRATYKNNKYKIKNILIHILLLIK